MKVLGLYNNECAIELFDWLRDQGNEVMLVQEKLDAGWCEKEDFDLAVSYTYRFIIPENIITIFKGNIVNLHNSYLPWNRGADPNLWSIVEGTPRGVTLHYVNNELDKGEIIAQELAEYDEEQSLHESYYHLDAMAKNMFMKAFRYYSEWGRMKKTPLGYGSYHSIKDGIRMKQCIDSYDITIKEFKKRMDNSEMVGVDD